MLPKKFIKKYFRLMLLIQMIVSKISKDFHPNINTFEETDQTNFRTMLLLQIIVSCTLGLASANVFTDPAVFERLCHFKNDGVVGFSPAYMMLDCLFLFSLKLHRSRKVDSINKMCHGCQLKRCQKPKLPGIFSCSVFTI